MRGRWQHQQACVSTGLCGFGVPYVVWSLIPFYMFSILQLVRSFLLFFFALMTGVFFLPQPFSAGALLRPQTLGVIRADERTTST